MARVRTALGYADGLDRANKLAAALFAVFAAAAVFAKAIGAPAWSALAFALVGVVGALVVLVLVFLHQRKQEIERREAMTLGPAVLLREAASAQRFYDLGVETEANEALARLGGSPRAAYVRRDVDAELVRALEQSATRERPSLVVVSGPAKAGKSRTALEAAAAAMPDAWLICPASAEALVELARAGCPTSEVGQGQGCVLRLDDIERFARPAGRGLGPDTLELLQGWGRPVVVLATHGGKGLALAGSEATRFVETTSDLLRRHPPVRLASGLSESERVRVRELYGEAAVAPIERAGIGEFMITAPRLIDRLENERDSPEGRSIALAAIDCQRAGLVRVLPQDWLEELYACYLPGPPGPERFKRGLEWATRPLYSNVALLVRGEGDPPGYHPYDYLVAHAQRRGDLIDPLLLDKVVDQYADSEQELLLAGAAADRRGDEERAARAWLRADESGSFHAALNLAFLLERRGDLSAAEAAYARADERGFADVEGHLGVSASVAIERHGYMANEERFRRADGQGDADAAVRLGLVLSRRGDADAAEAAFRRADERGSVNGAFNLAVILMRRGDLDAAQTAHRRAEQRQAALVGTGAGTPGLVL